MVMPCDQEESWSLTGFAACQELPLTKSGRPQPLLKNYETEGERKVA